jgi:hypothetical protein
MTHRSPLLTLAAVAIFFAALLTADFLVHPSAESATAGAPTRSSQPSSPTTPAPGPTPAAAAPTTPTRPEESALTTPAASATKHEDDGSFPHRAVYAGRSEDGHLAIAVAVLGDRAAAYLCDGRSREAWLRGTVDGDEITLTSRHGYRLTAELDHGRLEGEVRGDGKRWKFEIRRAEKPAGLYRAKGSKTTVGWIRLPDGSVVGVATAADGTSAPAPALGADDEARVDGQAVQATPVDGDDEIEERTR